MGLVTKTQSPLIGVDISSTAVKLLQLARTGDRYRVEHYAVEPLPPNAVVEKNLVEVEAVGEAIRRAVSRSGSRSKFAAAAVSGSSVITKTIPMPSDLDDDDMESQIELEAVNYIPYPIEEVNLDFEVLGPMPGNAEMVQVLLAASRSENVEMRASALELGGLTARVVDVEAFAIENAFGLIAGTLNIPRDGIVALVDDYPSALVMKRFQHNFPCSIFTRRSLLYAPSAQEYRPSLQRVTNLFRSAISRATATALTCHLP